MRKASIPSVGALSGGETNESVFMSEDFRGTLEVGWIPESGVEFFKLFIADLHNKWRVVLDGADEHLRQNVGSSNSLSHGWCL